MKHANDFDYARRIALGESSANSGPDDSNASDVKGENEQAKSEVPVKSDGGREWRISPGTEPDRVATGPQASPRGPKNGAWADPTSFGVNRAVAKQTVDSPAAVGYLTREAAEP